MPRRALDPTRKPTTSDPQAGDRGQCSSRDQRRVGPDEVDADAAAARREPSRKPAALGVEDGDLGVGAREREDDAGEGQRQQPVPTRSASTAARSQPRRSTIGRRAQVATEREHHQRADRDDADRCTERLRSSTYGMKSLSHVRSRVEFLGLDEDEEADRQEYDGRERSDRSGRAAG